MKNVDALVAMCDYYQVAFIKAACEDVLLRLPLNVPRLLLRLQIEICV